MSWDKMIARARRQATLSGQKSKVVATINSARTQRITGQKYTYVIMSPEGYWDTRCGEVFPLTGKPCIQRSGRCHYALHICRGEEKGTFLGWMYLDVDKQPTHKVTHSYYTKDVAASRIEKLRLL